MVPALADRHRACCAHAMAWKACVGYPAPNGIALRRPTRHVFTADDKGIFSADCLETQGASSGMTPDPAVTGTFRGIAFRQRDLSASRFDNCTLEGARFRDCNLSGVTIVGSWVDGLRVSSAHGQ